MGICFDYRLSRQADAVDRLEALETEKTNARDDYAAVRGMQEPQLHDDEEQEEAHRAAGNEEVLQHLPPADGAQGSEVVFIFAGRGTGRI